MLIPQVLLAVAHQAKEIQAVVVQEQAKLQVVVVVLEQLV
jgi:hypothetical protein